MSALGLLNPPRSMRLLLSVVREVWTEDGLRFARLEFFDDPPSICVWRRTGDVVRGCVKPIYCGLDGDARTLATVVDDAISASLDEIRMVPLTVSEAIEAAERRRCDRRWRP